MPRTAVAISISLLIPYALVAQAPTPPPAELCWHARPRDRCAVIFLTDFGIHSIGGRVQDSRLRALADWGLLVNTGARTALGATFMLSIDGDDFLAGPFLRYRRWLGAGRSLDLGVGFAAASSNGTNSSSQLGLIKYNPTHWIALAVRPEIRRRAEYTCDPPSCAVVTSTLRSRFHISAGGEIGWFPGAVLTATGSAILLAAIAALAGDN